MSKHNKPMTFKEFKEALRQHPSKKVYLRDMGGNKVEFVAVSNTGGITRLGVIQL